MNEDTADVDRRSAMGAARNRSGAASPGSPGRISRRSFCKSVAAGTVLAASASAAGANTPIDDEYGTVIDVADAGAATDGSTSVSPLLQDLVDDDTLLRFPPGEYYMDEEVRLTNFHNVGLVGDGATLVPGDYWAFDGPNYRLFRFGTKDAPGDGLRFESFTVDQRAQHTGIRAIEAQVADGLVVSDVDVVGTHDAGTWGPGLFTITDPDGSGHVAGFRAPDGALASVDTPGDIRYGPTGILCNGPHRGTMTFEHCVLGAFPDNGLYAAGGTGDVHVIGGRYENSGTASLRLGCGRGSLTGVTVRVDEDPFGLGREGIRLQYGDLIDVRDVTVDVTGPAGEAVRILDGVEGVHVSNSSIAIDSPGHTTGIEMSPGAGRLRIVGGHIRHDGPSDSGGYGIILKGEDNAAGAHLENVRIEGTVGHRGGRAGIYNQRDEVRLVSTQVDQPGGTKRAGIVNAGTDCTIYRGAFRASRYPIDEQGTGTWIQDVFTESADGAAGLCLRESGRNLYLADSTVRGGLRNFGSERPTTRNVVGV